jgi:hypothetical protein
VTCSRRTRVVVVAAVEASRHGVLLIGLYLWAVLLLNYVLMRTTLFISSTSPQS